MGDQRRILLHLVLVALAVLGFRGPALADEPAGEVLAKATARSSTTLLAGTRWVTQAYQICSGVDGPTVLIIGGIHGNEPAGAHAAERILDWIPVRGRLVVVPRANVPALEARTRRMPDLPRAESDLNRQFPMTSEEAPTGELAAALWSLVCEIRPDLLLDLHEGYHFTQIEPRSVGSSIIADRREDTKAMARIMLDVLNPTIEDPLKQFVLKSPMVSGSIARAASEVLNIPSMILETTTRSQPIELRSDQHLILVRTALSELGMLDSAGINRTPVHQDQPD